MKEVPLAEIGLTKRSLTYGHLMCIIPNRPSRHGARRGRSNFSPLGFWTTFAHGVAIALPATPREGIAVTCRCIVRLVRFADMSASHRPAYGRKPLRSFPGGATEDESVRQDVTKKVVEALYHRIDAIVAEVEAGLKTLDTASVEMEAEVTTANYGKLPRYAQDVCRAYWAGRVRSLNSRALRK